MHLLVEDIWSHFAVLLLQDGQKLAEHTGQRTVAGIKAFVESNLHGEQPPPPSGPRVVESKPAAKRRDESLMRPLLELVAAPTHRLYEGVVSAVHALGELDPLQAGLLGLGIASTCGVCFVLALCVMTTPSPR